MPFTGLGWDYFVPERLEFYGTLSLMKAGLLYADLLNTVSETYSREICGPEYGYRLDALLLKRSQDLFGIVNGIDSGMGPAAGYLSSLTVQCKRPEGQDSLQGTADQACRF